MVTDLAQLVTAQKLVTLVACFSEDRVLTRSSERALLLFASLSAAILAGNLL